MEVVAGLADISKSHLGNIERGDWPLNSIRLVVALAAALEISPSDILRLPVPAPANGHTDSTTEAIRTAFDAVEAGHPDGTALPTSVLRDQITTLQHQRRAAQFADVATALPAMIRNTHTTLNAALGIDRAELLHLATYLHAHVTRLWLIHACAPADLSRRCSFLTKRLAETSEDPLMVAVASLAVADTLLISGGVEVAASELATIEQPAITGDTASFVALLTLLRATAAQITGRSAERTAALESATDITTRFGDLDSLGYLITPLDVGNFRMFLALDADDPDHAITIAAGLVPEQHPHRTIQTTYWCDLGLALAQTRGRQADAIHAFRTAESLFPAMVRRDPLVRDALAGLVERSQRDAVGRELRGLAYRSGLPA